MSKPITSKVVARLVDQELFRTRAKEVIEAGRFLYGMGWVPATSGNFSARLDSDHAALTASGKHKGQLTPEDILVVDMQGRARGGKPSAETLLHTVLYETFPRVGAVLHTHSINATVLSMNAVSAGEDLVIEGYEMLKALAGITTHQTRIGIPVFANTQDMTALSADLKELLGRRSIHGFLIRGHGLYTWGRDMAETRRHIEAFEFLFACEMERRRMG